jgi:hypothetical protein
MLAAANCKVQIKISGQFTLEKYKLAKLHAFVIHFTQMKAVQF